MDATKLVWKWSKPDVDDFESSSQGLPLQLLALATPVQQWRNVK